MWHFAHAKNTSCDLFTENKMTEWHFMHQEKFPEQCREVRLKNGQKVHIADIKDGRAIIEFQHSPICNEDFEERSTFYSAFGHLIWVFDFIDKWMSDNPSIVPNNRGLKWQRASKMLSQYDFCSEPIVDVFLELQHGYYFLIKWGKCGVKYMCGEWMNEQQFREYIENVKSMKYGSGKYEPRKRRKDGPIFYPSEVGSEETYKRIYGEYGWFKYRRNYICREFGSAPELQKELLKELEEKENAKRAEYYREWRKKNPEKQKEYIRRYWEKKALKEGEGK